MKRITNVNLVFGARARRSRFNPLTHLTPELLAAQLDAFETGFLREAALVWETLEQRDDLLRTVIAKRKKAVARHGWTVLPKADLRPAEKEQAAEHAAALEYFYSHLECEHAVDRSQQGRFKLLARQMMDAVGKKFAVHEILWQVSDTQRGFVTAKFRFVPLAFFENTTGELRFLETESATQGRPLDPGSWMVTTGEGLMMASSTAWMFKHLALDDWLICSQKNGIPGLRGVSGSPRNSAEWTALEQSLADLLDGKAVVHSASEDVQVVDLLPRGSMPFPQLVERIDRLLAALWRGADLSTLSRDRGYGASLQEKETCALEEDDAEMLSETLNRFVDTWVIRRVFGEKIQPLAQVKVLVSPRECTTADLQIDEFLLRNGAPLSLQETMSRYGRAMPRPGDPILLPFKTQASYPESSHHPDMENHAWGPPVTFRDGSPLPRPDVPDAPAPDPCPLENQFALLQSDWLQLSPYGDFPHARGLQRVDRAAAEGMVDRFNSFRGRLGRLFGGVPFYIGHPDLPNANELADRKAYGWVMQLEAREDGLYGQVTWSDAGLLLLKNAHFKYLSPYWEAREIGTENGRRVYQPVALVSAGLTNQPNIPVKPLANESLVSAHDTNCTDVPLHPAGIMTSQPPPAIPTASLTEHLTLRRAELNPVHNRRDRIQEAVLAKTRLGLPYDEAWAAVKREHPTWFE